MEDKILEKETILPNDYPIYYSYYYLLDGKVFQNFTFEKSTVADLKKLYKVNEIRRCDIVERGLFF